MAPTNLWGEPDLPVPEQTPTSILNEQATFLSQITHGVLSGDVEVISQGSTFVITFYAVAPAVNNYRLSILCVKHGPLLYPARVGCTLDNNLRAECSNEAELLEILKSVFQSETVRQAIGALLAQSRPVTG